MSEQIKHECGIAMVRLRKPLDFYRKKYGTALYGLNKMYLLLQKQHNRGQDGAGLVSLKIDAPPGGHALHRERSTDRQPIKDVFDKVFRHFEKAKAHLHDSEYLKNNMPFAGELLLGHLRYGTFGGNTVESCHPFLRPNNWRTRYLALAGNFNMTNVDELFDRLIELGQSPSDRADTVTVMERIGHFLDKNVQALFTKYKTEGYSNQEISELIADNIDVQAILQRAAKRFDGGYVMGGIIGSGDSFVMRDPHGIRPAYYYYDDEIVVIASERPAIQTAINVHFSEVKELKPGHALIVKRNGDVAELQFAAPQKRLACSFERIYFSRGSDRDIYQERKALGFHLTERVLKAVNYDFANTVFSYIPNTAETAYRGLQEGVEQALNTLKIEQIKNLNGNLTSIDIERILAQRPRFESIAVKDAKLRTFITEDASRAELVSHVYDVTYGVVQDEIDTLVLIDDSIVRGTTLRESILKITARLRPKKIIIVSSAPQIRYPDCYGIDMSKMGEFVAFNALIALLKDHKKEYLLEETYQLCQKEIELYRNLRKEHTKTNKNRKSKVFSVQNSENNQNNGENEVYIAENDYQIVNHVQKLYDLFTHEQLEEKIAEIICPPNIKPEVAVLYQTLDGLHQSCPENLGDWYFSGNYPTNGGHRVVNQAFINFYEGKNIRAY